MEDMDRLSQYWEDEELDWEDEEFERENAEYMMKPLDSESPYWKPLLGMVNAIDRQIPLQKENQVLIVLSLNTEEKVDKFFDWVEERLTEKNKLNATEVEIVRAAVHINKGII